MSPADDNAPSKATLYKLTETAAGTAEKPPTVKIDGGPIAVQFNPTSLKIERSNDTSGGAQTRGQRRNSPNEGHATLSLELIFDTAEGGPDGEPLDVREKTAVVRQFAEPPDGNPKKAPPRLRFVWGKFSFDGIVSRIGEDLDYFSHEGLALRAKVSLTITEQRLKFESNASGQGARTDDATKPGAGQASTGPAAAPTNAPTQAVAAQDGESVQQVLSRLGLDPSTWRSAMAGLDSPLSLAAGAQVQLNAAASAGAGIGVSAGFSAGVSAGFSAGASAGASAGFTAGASAGLGASAELSAGASAGASASAGAAFGLDVSASAGASAAAGVSAFTGGAAGAVAGGAVSASGQTSAGFGLSAQGGVAATAGRALTRQLDGALAAQRASFSIRAGAGTTAGVSASASASVSAGAALDAQADAGLISRSVAASGAADIDPRAVGYGRGLPLRPRPVLRPATQR